MLKLTLIRHAPTQPNAEKRYPYPYEDAPLSSTGQQRASQLRNHLNLSSTTQVFSSPSLRTQQTAALAGLGTPTLTPALAEAKFGEMAGHTWAELEQRYGDLAQQWLLGLSDPTSNIGPPQGETGQTFHARIGGWLSTLPTQGDVIAVTHFGPCLAVLRLCLSLSAVAIPPACLIRLVKSQQGCQQDWWLEELRPLSRSSQ